MVTSSPRFSKKPRSKAIGNPIWSKPLTMPALSFTIVCAPAVVHPSASATPSINSRFILFSLFYRPNARHPVRPGHRIEIRSFDSTQFYRMVIRTGDPSISLKRQNVEAFRRKRQCDLNVDLLRRSGKIDGNLRWGNQGQPELEAEPSYDHAEYNAALGRLDDFDRKAHADRTK